MMKEIVVHTTRIHVVQKVNQLLTSAISTGVSDIHFEPFEDAFRVRYRIDGVLKDVEHLPYAQKEEIISRIKIMSDLDIAEKRRPQDGKLVFGVSGKNVDVRVSVLPTQFGEKVVLRLLDREQVKLDISSLGMDDHEIELFVNAYIKINCNAVWNGAAKPKAETVIPASEPESSLFLIKT